ncbi:MAG TPA: hypothetical protein VK625_02835 [Flavitalea sp.]|nr:hypothetical protein [Flavitalea sp.]
MKTKLFFFALFTLVFGSAATSFAQTATPRVTDRQINQQQRIGQGVKSGELTRHEFRNLEARQAKIRHDKKVAKSDGVVTSAERRKLNREQRRNSRAISRQKNDGQTRS